MISRNNAPDYKQIYTDIISKKYPQKKEECQRILEKQNISTIDILELNRKIFGTKKETEKSNQRHRSYSKSDILQILDYQKKNNLNNSQLANHFRISRNSVTKWKRMFVV